MYCQERAHTLHIKNVPTPVLVASCLVADRRDVQDGFLQSRVVQGRVVKDGVIFNERIIMGQIVQKRVVQNPVVQDQMVQGRCIIRQSVYTEPSCSGYTCQNVVF